MKSDNDKRPKFEPEMIWEDENPETGKRTDIVGIIGWVLIIASVLLIIIYGGF